jgi:two-component system cell cycle response regulator DivK
VNYDVVEAVNGQREFQGRAKPDLILMDLGMPVMDGWEATRRLKANGALKQIPIIAVTSHAMVGDEVHAREAGCDDYIPKPVDEEVLMQKVKKFIG